MIRAGFLTNLFFSCLISSISIPFFTSPALAAPIKAEAVYAAGKVSYVAAKDAVTRDVAVGIVFAEGDKIVTGSDGRVHIKIESGGEIRIDNNTEFVINSLRYGDVGALNMYFSLLTGRIKSSLSKIAEKDLMEYRTKAAIAGIAGTPEHILEVKLANGGKSQTNVYALEGKDGALKVQGFDPAKTSVMLTAGKGTSVIEGLAPLAPFVLTPAILEGIQHLTAATSHTSAAAGAQSSLTSGMSGTTIAAVGGGAALVAVAAGGSGGGGGSSTSTTTPATPATPSTPTTPVTDTIAGSWRGTWTVTSPSACAGISGSWSASFTVSGDGQLSGTYESSGGYSGGTSGYITGTQNGASNTWSVGGSGGETFSGSISGSSISGSWWGGVICPTTSTSTSGTFSGSRS